MLTFFVVSCPCGAVVSCLVLLVLPLSPPNFRGLPCPELFECWFYQNSTGIFRCSQEFSTETSYCPGILRNWEQTLSVHPGASAGGILTESGILTQNSQNSPDPGVAACDSVDLY